MIDNYNNLISWKQIKVACKSKWGFHPLNYGISSTENGAHIPVKPLTDSFQTVFKKKKVGTAFAPRQIGCMLRFTK